MGVNFSTLLYDPVFDMFAVPVTFDPQASQPGQPTYWGRGIFDTDDINVIAEDGSVYSDHHTLLYLREAEFPVIPLQGDHVVIPADCNGVDQGEWMVSDACTNGGGQHKLTLKKWEAAAP